MQKTDNVNKNMYNFCKNFCIQILKIKKLILLVLVRKGLKSVKIENSNRIEDHEIISICK